ncbi:hypothetical protein SLEP1_g24795 [Rubroshorea leprosula]|uniref:NAD-dependent epimerase/dehydratase domain-containing protein n=1 Tax=Rubroshorea leprosula TaxID=152421 RepID=A0AAV5JRA1_9ROSI|nr:hypothetical protein SLEP1_g24795 [Rubroshorea leprosula]
MSGERKVVCVTGASGFIASWLVKLLLDRGYTVKATIRDPNDPKETEHLLALNGAKERLHLFKAELLDEGSFDCVVDGCDGVFHTASPVFFDHPDYQAELIDAAVKGTLNVLKSCAKVASTKRVVLTSSTAAVLINEKPLTPDVVVDETWFSDPAFCEKAKLWYVLSKTLAEEAAWKFAKENRLDLITINPVFVIGPILQPTLNLTVELILNIVTGRELPSYGAFVDVRDVAHAHIQAFEIPSATGRYCMVESTIDVTELWKILHRLFPVFHLNEKFEDKPIQEVFQISKEKIKSLGVNFIPLEESLKDTIECLKEKGFISF